VRKNIIVGPNLYPLNNLLYFKPMPDIVIFSLKIGTLACFMIAHIQLDLSCYLDLLLIYLFTSFLVGGEHLEIGGCPIHSQFGIEFIRSGGRESNSELKIVRDFIFIII
jgi:hypothetical protein